jgi:glycosyltransferase involved in cell wall biosynthesis
MAVTTPRPVMFVLPNLGGGAARVIVTLLQHLDRARFSLHLVVVDTFYGWYLREVPSDVTLHVLGKRRASRAVLKLLSTIWRVRPAIVVSTQGYINFMLLLTHPFFPRCKLVVREVVGERYLENSRYRDLFYRWYLRLVRRADRIVTQSDAVAREMSASVRAPAGRVVRIHNPVDTERLSRERCGAPSPFRGRGPHVLGVGRLTHQKGFDLLLDAFAGARVHAPGATLTILGVGDDQRALETQAADLGIADAVRLAGFQEDPHPYFAHADVFALSSRYEGLPNALLEALASGCAVVAFDCPHGVGEIVRDGVNGILVPREDVAGFTAALTRLLTSAAERERLRAQIGLTIAPFSAPVIAARWGAMFDTLTA